MSRLLVEERARIIWGDQVKEVNPVLLESKTECWHVILYSPNAYWHKFDADGHAICHKDCADIEVQLCV